MIKLKVKDSTLSLVLLHYLVYKMTLEIKTRSSKGQDFST